MTVFKTFWKIIKKYKGTIILYTIMLVSFGGINLSSKEANLNFTNEKPDVLIVNQGENIGLTKNLIDYLSQNTNIVQIENFEEKRNDALFYRDVNYIIYINNDYREKILNGENVTLDIKSTNDYSAHLAEMILNKYLTVQNLCRAYTTNEQELINKINKTLKEESKVVVSSKVDKTAENKVSRYFNFASYSILAAIIFIITLVMTSFKEKTINKRITVSSMNYKKHNNLLLISGLAYVLVLWLLYTLLAIILLKSSVLNTKGLLYILNSLVFSLSALTFALLISTLVKNKDAIGGIVNVVALGSAFLCGAFLPVEYLGSNVLKLAHIFPAYYYINTNNKIMSAEIIDKTLLTNILPNTLTLILFMILFIIINNLITKQKRSNS
ncbi:MAG: ABC transporter permease [Tenericutes bacterium]|nr:ABC transporter permease [Mycoplasmatota bacterium]